MKTLLMSLAVAAGLVLAFAAGAVWRSQTPALQKWPGKEVDYTPLVTPPADLFELHGEHDGGLYVFNRRSGQLWRHFMGYEKGVLEIDFLIARSLRSFVDFRCIFSYSVATTREIVKENKMKISVDRLRLCLLLLATNGNKQTETPSIETKRFGSQIAVGCDE